MYTCRIRLWYDCYKGNSYKLNTIYNDFMLNSKFNILLKKNILNKFYKKIIRKYLNLKWYELTPECCFLVDNMLQIHFVYQKLKDEYKIIYKLDNYTLYAMIKNDVLSLIKEYSKC